MRDRRGLVGVASLSWLLASFATAAISHALIGLLGDAGESDAYGRHAHAAVAPVALAAISGLVALLLRSTLRSMGGSDARDPAASLRETCARIRPIGPIVAVCVGGLATLLGMELCEQVCDLGQFTGVADALGGNAAAGLAIIAVVATIVTVSSLRSAHVLLARAVAVAYAVMFWIVAGRRVGDPVITIRRIASHREVCALALRERGFGMRAPPLQANVFP